MHETWDPERLLTDCDTASRERYSSTTRDLLTEPRWGKWEGVPDYEDGPATQIDARDTVVCVFTASPSRRAQRAVLCGLALAALGVAWMLAQGLGWM